MEIRFSSGSCLALLQGDITKVAADAITNAANSSLAGGGGVDGAIHRAGGPSIMRALDTIRKAQGGCPTGSAVVTTAGLLPAKFVFHAVGPIWYGGERGESKLLESAYQACLHLADERGLTTMTFPSISTGAYRFPIRDAAHIAIGCVARHLAARTGSLSEVTFVLFDGTTLAAYETGLASISEGLVQ